MSETDNKVLTAALKYYDMGWCILPAKKGEKHPIIPWKEYQYKRPTREQIIEWFKDGNYNIFLVAGKISGICIVDVDVTENGGFTGEADELIRKLPLTLLSITGRKGHHYFFKYPNDKELGNFVGKIPGIDFRGEGGGVILPPSIHQNGSEYFFDITEDIELCNLLEMICDFPYELFKDCFELIGNRVSSIETNYQLATEGKRNSILMSHAGTIFRQFADRPELARLLVLGLNQKICNPPLPEEEIEKTILASISRYHPLNARRKDDWSNPLLADELLKLEDDDKENWLVKGLIPKAGSTVISGDPGSNKTWIDMATAIAVASGSRLFNFFDTEQCPVWIIDKENNKQAIKNRLKLLGLEAGLPIYISSTKDFVFDLKNRNKILDFACEKEIKLVIYDSLRRIHSGDENSSTDISGLFELLTSLHVEDISNILTHHHNKNTFASGGSKMRGSSDILASIDCHITVSKRSNKEIIVEQSKNRYGEELKPFKLKILTDTTSYFKFQYEGETDLGAKRNEVRRNITELLKSSIEPIGRKTILDSIKDVASCGNDLIDDILKEMADEGVLIKDKNWSGKSGERVFYRLA